MNLSKRHRTDNGDDVSLCHVPPPPHTLWGRFGERRHDKEPGGTAGMGESTTWDPGGVAGTSDLGGVAETSDLGGAVGTRDLGTRPCQPASSLRVLQQPTNQPTFPSLSTFYLKHFIFYLRKVLE